MPLLLALAGIGSAIGTYFAGESRYAREKEDRDKMIADERAYNSEEAQAKRLEGIGLNPYYHMTGGMSRTEAGKVIEAPDNSQGLAVGLGFVNQIMGLNTAQIQQSVLTAQKNKLLKESALLGYQVEGEKALNKWLSSVSKDEGTGSAIKGVGPLVIQLLRSILR